VNVGQIISSEGFYGAESMLVDLSRSLARLGCTITVVVFHDRRNPHIELAMVASAHGLNVKTIECRGRWDWRSVREIRQFGRDKGIDIFHTHGYKADIYTYAATRRERVVTISTCHNWPNRKLLMQAYAKGNRLVLRHFHHVTSPSVDVIRTLRRSGICASRIAHIPNGVEISRFQGASPRLRQELPVKDNPLIGFVGRHVNDKGGATLLGAARQVLAAHPEVHFAFVGDGPDRGGWMRLAADLGIAEHVHFTGTRHDMPEVYASFDLLVLPSFDEAMPMCLLEAMASGVPVIATRVGSIPDLIVSGVTGRLTEPGDAPALTHEMIYLLDNSRTAAELGGAGRRRVDCLFSADAMARKYLAIYRQSLGMRPFQDMRNCATPL
jgi:glycosyltransferase involved in cell wall biosynthesis